MSTPVPTIWFTTSGERFSSADMASICRRLSAIRGVLAWMVVKVVTTNTKLPSEGVRLWTPGAPPHYDLTAKP